MLHLDCTFSRLKENRRIAMRFDKRADRFSSLCFYTHPVKMNCLQFVGTKAGQLALFPLPPFDEQKRIVERLEELLTLCNELSEEP
jgi:hypothetical protein